VNHPDPVAQTRTIGGPRTLLELCLDLRMAHNGSADPISEEETAAALAYLNHRLATWKPSILPSGARFDECVRGLVLATIIEVQCRQAERARILASPSVQSPITDAAIDTAVTEADPLAGLPAAERLRIIGAATDAGIAARDARMAESQDADAARSAYGPAHHAALVREVAAYRAQKSAEESAPRIASREARYAAVMRRSAEIDAAAEREPK
jgi:hypothetical protein